MEQLPAESCVVLSGVAGVGKTSLTHKIAKTLRYADGKRALHTFLIPSATPQQLRWGLAQLATDEYFALGASFPKSGEHNGENFENLVEESVDEEAIDQAIAAVKRKLSSLGNWLLVFDNMDDYFYKDGRHQYEAVKPFFPSLENGGRILITTLDQGENIAHRGLNCQSIERLTPEEGAQFLLPRIWPKKSEFSPAQLEQAVEISTDLSGLLLTLDQAAAYIGEQIDEMDSYTLQAYLSDYEAKGKELRATRPRGEHASIYRTVTMALGKLCDPTGHSSQQLVASLLLTCASFHHEKISLTLFHGFHPAGMAQTPSVEEIVAAARRAKKLRLLDIIDDNDADSDSDREVVIRIHRAVHGALQDICKLSHEGAEQTSLENLLGARAQKDWSLAMRVLERELGLALAQREFSAELSPHLNTFFDNTDVEERLNSASATYPLLHEQMAQRTVLRALKDGDSWETLLFGGETPSYETMHHLQDKEGEDTLKWRIAAIRHTCGEEFGRVVFACLYLVVHYWWDTYLADDYLAKPLLDHWEEKSEADKMLLKNLRVLQNHYPPVHDYKTRATETDAWNKVGRAMLELRQQLGIDTPASTANSNSAKNFARAITNFSLAEALRYGDEMEGYTALESQPALQLYQDARELLKKNNDEFHSIWARWELANYYLEAGQNCQAHAQTNPQDAPTYHAKARTHFKNARNTCDEGLEAAIERAAEDDLDAEVVAGFYSLLADIGAATEADVTKIDALEITGYRCAACYLAYAFILHEADSYSIAFYGEQSERMMDWLTNCAPDQRLVRCKYLQSFWKRQTLDDTALAALISNPGELRAELFPIVPKLEGLIDNAELTSTDETQIKDLIRGMEEQIKRLSAEYPLDLTTLASGTLVRVAALLKEQLEKSEPKPTGE